MRHRICSLIRWRPIKASAARLRGETGDRSIIRYPGYVALDMGLYKSFDMPWSEKHKLQIRWEVFNVTNTQRFTGNADNTFGLDPQNGTARPDVRQLHRNSRHTEGHAVRAPVDF